MKKDDRSEWGYSYDEDGTSGALLALIGLLVVGAIVWVVWVVAA
jgi:hypothetical protein